MERERVRVKAGGEAGEEVEEQLDVDRGLEENVRPDPDPGRGGGGGGSQ